MQSHARVVIIGGGAMGVSLAYHLPKAGWSDVVLIEKNELTAGSTWHAAGLCTHFAHNLTLQALRAHSVKLYSGILEEETGNPVGFHATGALRVTRSRDRMDEFRHVQGIGRYSGYDFNILTPAELKEIYPLVETDGLIGAIHEPDLMAMWTPAKPPTPWRPARGPAGRRSTATRRLRRLSGHHPANGW